jgi:hypothetical protein
LMAPALTTLFTNVNCSFSWETLLITTNRLKLQSCIWWMMQVSG